MADKNNGKSRAIAALKEVAEKKAAPYVKKVGDRAQKYLEKNVGIDKKTMAKALAIAEMARSGRIKGKARIGQNTKLTGEIDVKNKAIKAGLTYDW